MPSPSERLLKILSRADFIERANRADPTIDSGLLKRIYREATSERGVDSVSLVEMVGEDVVNALMRLDEEGVFGAEDERDTVNFDDVVVDEIEEEGLELSLPEPPDSAPPELLTPETTFEIGTNKHARVDIEMECSTDEIELLSRDNSIERLRELRVPSEEAETITNAFLNEIPEEWKKEAKDWDKSGDPDYDPKLDPTSVQAELQKKLQLLLEIEKEENEVFEKVFKEVFLITPKEAGIAGGTLSFGTLLALLIKRFGKDIVGPFVELFEFFGKKKVKKEKAQDAAKRLGDEEAAKGLEKEIEKAKGKDAKAARKLDSAEQRLKRAKKAKRPKAKKIRDLERRVRDLKKVRKDAEAALKKSLGKIPKKGIGRFFKGISKGALKKAGWIAVLIVLCEQAISAYLISRYIELSDKSKIIRRALRWEILSIDKDADASTIIFVAAPPKEIAKELEDPLCHLVIDQTIRYFDSKTGELKTEKQKRQIPPLKNGKYSTKPIPIPKDACWGETITTVSVFCETTPPKLRVIHESSTPFRNTGNCKGERQLPTD